jgi:hypothetical protein
LAHAEDNTEQQRIPADDPLPVLPVSTVTPAAAAIVAPRHTFLSELGGGSFATNIPSHQRELVAL